MKRVIAITGASSRFGEQTSRELAKAGHVVYVDVYGSSKQSSVRAKALRRFVARNNVDLRPIVFDRSHHSLAAEAIQQIVNECGRLDVLIHIAGPGAFGPIEHSDRDRVAQLYGTYMLSIQRLNLAAIQAFADQGHGLVTWVVGSQIGEGAQQHLGPYLAAKGALDALASSYAAGLVEHNVETTILLPGALDNVRAIVEVVEMPAGTRPLLVHPDGNQIGKEPARGSRVRPRSSDCRNMQLSGLFLSTNLKAIDIYS